MSEQTTRPQDITTPWYKKAMLPWLILSGLAILVIGLIIGNQLTMRYQGSVKADAAALSAITVTKAPSK